MQKPDLDTQLCKEIDLFMSEGAGGIILSWTTLPTIVDCNRCFSTAPYIDYKIKMTY